MSANIRADIERRYGTNPPAAYKVRKVGAERVVCDAFRRYDRGRCHSTVLYPNGRCRVHGGPSTGPRTSEGRSRSLAALAKFNADRATARPEAVIRRLAAEGRSLGEIAESVPAWIIPRIRAFLIAEERNG
jgi:hypothetical protein